MANVSSANLTDKDIRGLEFKDQMYFKVVGNPKEALCICLSQRAKDL